MPTADQAQEFFDTFHNGIVAGIRKDGTPHLSPNWYSYEGGKIYVSTKRDRVKYRLFANDPRVTFLVDDPAGMRYVSLAGTVTFREDLENVIKLFKRIRELVGVETGTDEEYLQFLRNDNRVLLVITPDGPPESWTSMGF